MLFAKLLLQLLGVAPLPLQLPWRPVVAAAPGEQHGAGTARCLAPRGHESLRRTALHLRQAGQHPPPLALPRPPAASSVGPGWGAAAAPPAAVGDTLAARAGEAGAATPEVGALQAEIRQVRTQPAAERSAGLSCSICCSCSCSRSWCSSPCSCPPCLTAQPPRAQERAAGWRGRSDRSPPSRVPRPQQVGTPEVQKLQRGGESGGGRGGGGGGRCCRGGMSGGATGGEQRPSLFSFRVRISASDFADFAHLDLDLCVSIHKQHI